MTSAMRKDYATTTRGLNRESPPMKLYEKAKRYGVWNPSDIDFTQDKRDWAGLAPDEQDMLRRLTAQFQAGEEAVTLDLLPLIHVIAQEGRIEEEMFLTTFLFEEAKHTDFFSRFLLEVAGGPGDLSRYHLPNYRQVFYEALPTTLDRLRTDMSPEAQVVAAVTYNMIVEGVLAETGYHTFYTTLRANGLMPGTTFGIDRIKQDESRHIAYGMYLIARLVAVDPELWPTAEAQMNALLGPALGVVTEAFEQYDPIPFDLDLETFTDYAMGQFQKRMARITAARDSGLSGAEAMADDVIEADDA